MLDYNYEKSKNKFTENGHTMFEEDVLQRLRRLAQLEERNRFIQVTERTPTATETGDWDGKRSDFVLAKNKNGSHYILRVYEGFSSGEKWVDWADKNDMIHTEIVEWRSFL